MSTAGKRRADGPAVTGGRPKGGARKATTKATKTAFQPVQRVDVLANPGVAQAAVEAAPPTNPIVPAALPATPTPLGKPPKTNKPVKAAKASKPVKGRKGRSPKTPYVGGGSTWVREDQMLALRTAVEALGETFDATAWSFDQSNLLLTAARRLSPTGTGHDLLVISNECYTGWVAPGQDPIAVTEALAAAAPLASMQIEWILDGQVNFGVGPWLLRPIDRRGWVATKRTRTRSVWHFVVDAAGDFTPVHSDDRAAVDGALIALAQARHLRQNV